MYVPRRFMFMSARNCLAHFHILTVSINMTSRLSNKQTIQYCISACERIPTEQHEKLNNIMKFNHTSNACRERVDRGIRTRKQNKQTSDTVEGDGKHKKREKKKRKIAT